MRLKRVCRKCEKECDSTRYRSLVLKEYKGPCGDSFCFASCDSPSCRPQNMTVCDGCAVKLEKPKEKTYPETPGVFAKNPPGKTVRMLRELNYLTQAQLAARSGLRQSTISAIENGTKKVGVVRAKKLANALHVHPAVIAFSDWEESAESLRRRKERIVR